MRFSIVVPDEVKPTIRDRAADAGISQTEWARRLVLAGCTSGTPPGAPLHTSERDALEARILELEDLYRTATTAIASAMAERDRLAAEHDRLEDERTRAKTKATEAAADRDQAREDLAAMTTRATEAAIRVAVLEAEAKKDAEHIASLQKTIFTFGEVARPTLPAPAAETTRPGILDGIRAWLRR